jgi:hypothetical protein
MGQSAPYASPAMNVFRRILDPLRRIPKKPSAVGVRWEPEPLQGLFASTGRTGGSAVRITPA